MSEMNVSATVGMSATVGEMSATVGEMSATVGEMSATVGEMSATVGEMSATVGEMTATVGEMSATVGKLNNPISWDMTIYTRGYTCTYTIVYVNRKTGSSFFKEYQLLSKYCYIFVHMKASFSKLALEYVSKAVCLLSRVTSIPLTVRILVFWRVRI